MKKNQNQYDSSTDTLTVHELTIENGDIREIMQSDSNINIISKYTFQLLNASSHIPIHILETYNDIHIYQARVDYEYENGFLNKKVLLMYFEYSYYNGLYNNRGEFLICDDKYRRELTEYE